MNSVNLHGCQAVCVLRSLERRTALKMQAPKLNACRTLGWIALRPKFGPTRRCWTVRTDVCSLPFNLCRIGQKPPARNASAAFCGRRDGMQCLLSLPRALPRTVVQAFRRSKKHPHIRC